MSPIQKSESLKKVLHRNPTFDEAEYYRSARHELGGDDGLNESGEKSSEDEEEEGEDSEVKNHQSK